MLTGGFMRSFVRSVAVTVVLSLVAFNAGAQPAPNLPLLPADPGKPLLVVADQSWVGPMLRPAPDGPSQTLNLGYFTYEAAKGPVNLVIDFAGTRRGEGKPSAIVEIGIECPESGTPCAIPIDKGVVEFREAFMADEITVVAGAPLRALLGREGHSYDFPDGTVVSVTLDVLEARGVDPRAIRARLVYGAYSDEGLPAHQTRSSLLRNILLVIGGLVVFAWIFLRRR